MQGSKTGTLSPPFMTPSKPGEGGTKNGRQPENCFEDDEEFSNPLRGSTLQAAAAATSDAVSLAASKDSGFVDASSIDTQQIGAGGELPSSPFRVQCQRLAASHTLEWSALMIAAVSSILLAIDSPAFPPSFRHELFIADVVITSFFVVECLVKIIAFGFIASPDAYLIKSSENRLDFAVATASLVGLFVKSPILRAIRSLRMFMLMRLLRKIGTVETLVQAVWQALDLFRDVSGLLLFAVFTFSIIGLNFFSGMLSHSCESRYHSAAVVDSVQRSSSGSWEEEQWGTKSEVASPPEPIACPPMLACEDSDHTGMCIRRSEYFAVSDKEVFGYHGFDSLGQAIATVFVQMTADGGMQDVPHIINYGIPGAAWKAKFFAWPFFFIVVVVCSWVILSLFTAVLSSEFSVLSTEERARVAAAQEEEDLVRRQNSGDTNTFEDEADTMTEQPSTLVLHCRKIAESTVFTLFIAGCILLSVSMLFDVGIEPPEWVAVAMSWSDRIFIAIFFVEFLIKVTAYTWAGYWAEGSNRLDFLILLITMGGSIVAIVAIESSGVDSVSPDVVTEDASQSFLSLRLPRLLRLARLSGMMRFLYLIDSVRMVFETVFAAWKKILSLCTFIIFMQCVFSVFGMQFLGGSLPPGTPETTCWGGAQWGGLPGADCGQPIEYTRRNFETFGRAFLSTFQYMTGESWSQIMFWYANHGTSGQVGPYIFFMLLFVWQFSISISLFVAILLDNFSLTEEEKIKRQVELYDLEQARKLGASDPYVEVSLIQGDHSPSSKKKQIPRTPVIRDNCNPVWDTDNVFDLQLMVPPATASRSEVQSTLLLSVMDWDRASADDFLGEIRIDVKVINLSNDANGIDEENNGATQRQLIVEWDTKYRDLQGIEQTRHSDITLVEGQISDQTEIKLEAGPNWDFDGPVQGRVTIILGFRMGKTDQANWSTNGTLDTGDEAIITVTVCCANDLLAEDAEFKEEDAAGIVARAFSDEFNMPERVAPEHNHAVAVISGRQARSLNIFPPGHPLRILCIELVENVLFDVGIIGCIVLSCLVLAWEGPPEKFESSEWKPVVLTLNAVLCLVFIGEAGVKIVAYGFKGKTSVKFAPYLSDPMNVLDFFVVNLISLSYIVTFIWGSSAGIGEIARTLRILRVITPLRVAMRSERIKTILRAFKLAAPAVGSVFAVLLMFLIMFAIIGTEVFGGLLNRCCLCSDTLIVVRNMKNGTLIKTQEQCLMDSFCWDNPAYSFDTTASSMQTLFKTMTAHGWVDIMESVMDNNGVGMQPSRNAMPGAAAYFIVFHVVVTFFMLNLLVGVMASSFSEANNTNLFTRKQKEWVREKHLLSNFGSRLDAEDHEWKEDVSCFALRTKCNEIANNKTFEDLIVWAIVLNVIVMAMEHYPMTPTWRYRYGVANSVFLMIFTVECTIKSVGYGFKLYCADKWNVMDIVVVACSWLSIIAGARSGLEVLRVFRVFRVFLIVNHFEGLMALYSTILRSLPAAVDVFVLSILLFFIYAIIGMNLFGDLQPQQCDVECPGRFNQADNFGDFFHAMKLLCQTTVSQATYNLMHDLSTGRDGVSSGTVFMFFGSFKFLSDFVFINLIVGIILDTFDNTFSTEESIFHVDDLMTFREQWKEQALARAALLGADERIRHKLIVDPGRVPLPINRIHTIIKNLVEMDVLRVAGEFKNWRGYCLLQLEIWANKNSQALRKKRRLPKALPGVLTRHATEDTPGFVSPSGRQLRWSEQMFPSGLDFDRTIKRLILFELSKDAVLHVTKMEELEVERLFVSKQIVQCTVRSWMWISIARTNPSCLPAEWRDRPTLFRSAVVGVRNTRLSILLNWGRYISGKFKIEAMERVRREEEESIFMRAFNSGLEVASGVTSDLISGELYRDISAKAEVLGKDLLSGELVRDVSAKASDAARAAAELTQSVATEGLALTKEVGGTVKAKASDSVHAVHLDKVGGILPPAVRERKRRGSIKDGSQSPPAPAAGNLGGDEQDQVDLSELGDTLNELEAPEPALESNGISNWDEIPDQARRESEEEVHTVDMV